MAIQTKNPATLEVLKTFEEISDVVLGEKITKAQTAFGSWKETTFAERAVLMHKMADYLREHAEEMGTMVSIEMGKTKIDGINEVKKCANCCDYYADNAEKMLSHE